MVGGPSALPERPSPSMHRARQRASAPFCRSAEQNWAKAPCAVAIPVAADLQAGHEADTRRMTAATHLRAWFRLPGLPAGANPASVNVRLLPVVCIVLAVLPTYSKLPILRSDIRR